MSERLYGRLADWFKQQERPSHIHVPTALPPGKYEHLTIADGALWLPAAPGSDRTAREFKHVYLDYASVFDYLDPMIEGRCGSFVWVPCVTGIPDIDAVNEIDRRLKPEHFRILLPEPAVRWLTLNNRGQWDTALAFVSDAEHERNKQPTTRPWTLSAPK